MLMQGKMNWNQKTGIFLLLDDIIIVTFFLCRIYFMTFLKASKDFCFYISNYWLLVQALAYTPVRIYDIYFVLCHDHFDQWS